MGRTIKLKEAVNLIWETVKITEEQTTNNEVPYLFIVGAGISAPEILSAQGIVHHCQDKVKELYRDENDINEIFEKSNCLSVNSAKYYSYWFGQAYKNKIHRQQYLKQIIDKARISTSNLLLAQILNSKKMATTVITPNFDNQLLKSLNLLGNYNVFSANNVLDNIALTRNSSNIQIMHVHGTYEFYDCCNLEHEITRVASETGIKSTAGTIEEFLKNQAPIVMGYSGWEDDVIMSKIQERLMYAPLPYSLIWFCYSQRDYEILPEWLKLSDDVIFVLPEIANEEEKITDDKEKYRFLPAEDVLSALISKFEFEAPKLFSNPIHYYIDLIDGFFPENIDIFPVKAWKRRLNHIEEHLEDIEKKLIDLDTAAARKDVIEITKILKTIDYNFISKDDLEHIVNGIMLPSLSNKNRIENEQDICAFVEKILELLQKRKTDIECNNLKRYLLKIIDFLSAYKRKGKKEDLIIIYDSILEICENNEEYLEIELIALGMKSDISNQEEKTALRNSIIEKGIEKIEDEEIGRLLIIAIEKLVLTQKYITEEQMQIMNNILIRHEKSRYIKEIYYKELLNLYDEDIPMQMEISEIIEEVIKKDVSKKVLFHARCIQCEKQEEIQEKVDTAISAIEEYDYEAMDSCRECLDYAFFLKTIILGTIFLKKSVEQRYIDLAIKLCYREEGCRMVSKIIMDALNIYVNSIDSQFEKRELCKKAIDICEKSTLHIEWTYFCDVYIEVIDKQDREDFLSTKNRYQRFIEARERMSMAIQEYVKGNKEICKDILLECSEIFDELFDGKYNPALINVCFMARRGEMPDLNISVLQVLNELTWMNNDAFLNINKALVYVMEEKWADARQEIKNIDSSISKAIEWWKQEQVVGKVEKNIVLLLLILENKIPESFDLVKTKEFWKECNEIMDLPAEIKNELVNLQNNYLAENV